MGYLHGLGAFPPPPIQGTTNPTSRVSPEGLPPTPVCVRDRNRVGMGKVRDFQAAMGSVIEEIPSDDGSWGKMGTSEVIRTGRKFLSLANARRLPKSGEY